MSDTVEPSTADIHEMLRSLKRLDNDSGSILDWISDEVPNSGGLCDTVSLAIHNLMVFLREKMDD